MQDREELVRIKNVEVGPIYHTKCIVCNKSIMLWLNGGELDTECCCGYEYTL